MLDILKSFQYYIFGAILALSVLGTGSIVRSHYVEKIDKIENAAKLAKKERELKYEQDLADNKKKAGKVKEGYDKLSDALVIRIRDIETKGKTDALELEKMRDSLRHGGSNARVFRDPGKGAVCPSTAGSSETVSRTPGAAQGSTQRELSREATEFLLDYGTTAEIMRRDLLDQIEYSKEVKRLYDGLVNDIKKANSEK